MAGADAEGRTPGGDERPVPDPTRLTTEQLHREMKGLRELLETKIDGVEEVVRLQFETGEKLRVEQKTDTKTAVDAALSAQKEAVREQTIASGLAIAKSEAATTKQLEQLDRTFTTALVGVTSVLTDVKERVGRIESIKAGGQQAYTGLYAMGGLIVAIAAVLVAVLLTRP